MPIIMLFNGNAAKVERGCSTLEQFLEKGYGGVINIYRGYGIKPGEPSQQNFFDDAKIAYNTIKELYPENEVIFFCFSIGSGTATYMASKFDNKALIIEGGFSSLQDVAKSKYPFLPVNKLLKDKFLNKEYIKNVKSDILILHGLEDEAIDVSFAQKLASYNDKSKLLTYEAGDYINLKCLDAYKDAIKWLDTL